MTAHTPQEVDKVPVIRISYNANVSDKAGLIFETYVPQDAELATINGVVDKLVSVTERRESAAKLEALEKEVRELDNMIDRMLSDVAHVEQNALKAHQQKYGGKRDVPEFKLTQAEQTNKANVEQTLKTLHQRHAAAIAELEAHKQRAGGA